MTRQDLRRYALAGAEQRLLELGVEAAHIFRSFPELRNPGRGFDAVGGSSARTASGRTGRGRGRTMSAEARKRISDAQKARWARHRSRSGARKKK